MSTAGTIERSAAPARPRRRPRLARAALLLPAGVLLGVFFAYPLISMVVTSFMGDGGGLTLDKYREVLEVPTYLTVFRITFEIAALVTVATALVAYPLTYVIVTGPKLLGSILRGLVIIPFFVSLLVRTYAWLVVLSPDGIVNQTLHALGAGPVQLLYNRTGVIIGMTYALLPYMVFALYGNMRSVDTRLLQAAQNLGAGPWRAFRTVFLPLTFPGIAAGSILVFILACGFFITPKLMGGPGDVMIGSLITTLVSERGQVDDVAAIGTVLLAITVVGFLAASRFVGLRALLESRE
ncbi:ABC transporter permease [Dactylosporangium sp. CA-092794]|uniref:ABC transporter permease n=1 Tax=Dactylosporangium sp. CA-092794 TaxID=3239929 RepID=UPI003D8CBF88